LAKLAFIQGLRASAALAIIAFHLSDHISRSGYTGRIVTEMGYVVLLFFVISGFVIYYTLERRTESNLLISPVSAETISNGGSNRKDND
jgi:peptidoglycan/LPS O-acetylase OafA/YrhL